MYSYHLTLRPMNIGCYPEPIGTAWEFGESHFPPIRRAWGNDYGTIIYSRPLSFDRIWHFDLRPADACELARYMFWLNADRNDARAQWLIEDYMSTDRVMLDHLSTNRSDGLAEHALVLLNAGAKAEINSANV